MKKKTSLSHQDSLDAERNLLMNLANDIIRVKDRHELIEIFTNHFKSLFDFSHAIITVIDPKDDTYSPFLVDSGSGLFNTHPQYDEMIKARFSIHEPFIKTVHLHDGPSKYKIEDLIISPQSPDYLKLNYELGIKEALMIPLRMEDKPIGFIHIHSDQENSFTENFIELAYRITPHISSALTNIIKNDEILKREKEKSFLLDFSNEMTAVRTKSELGKVVNEALRKLTKGGYVIRKLDTDKQTMSSYLWDDVDDTFKSELSQKSLEESYPVNDGLQNRVLESYIPLLFSVDMESRKSDAPYVAIWKEMGFKTMVGAALRNKNDNIGILWLSIDEINIPILKGVCSQIAISMANIIANEELIIANNKILSYKKQLEDENTYLKEQVNSNYFSGIVGNGVKMNEIYRLMSLVSDTNSTVLILGETGTGKELIAREIHKASSRRNKLMIKVNCAAMPANLIESELFGHEKGAFTSALERKIGKFELANHSTIFLDEIGEMPLEAQGKLLRVLQEKEMERVGGVTTIKLDVRIIAATNRDLEEEVRQGRFRSDLFYRLNVFPLTLPPLRERTDDIESLVEVFLKKSSKSASKKVVRITQNALRQLCNYSWPGNVRELEHLIERSVLLSSGNTIKEVHLPAASSNRASDTVSFDYSMEEMERFYIINVLKKCNGKISGFGSASEILKIPGNTLHSKIKKLNITKADYFSI